MKKYIYFIFAIVLITSCNSKNKHFYKFIHDAETMNKSCPMSIAENITIDSTTYNIDKNSMNYYFSISGELDNKNNIEKNYNKIKKGLEDEILNSVDMIEYQRHNVTLNYIYFSNTTKERLATFNFPLKNRSNQKR